METQDGEWEEQEKRKKWFKNKSSDLKVLTMSYKKSWILLIVSSLILIQSRTNKQINKYI